MAQRAQQAIAILAGATLLLTIWLALQPEDRPPPPPLPIPTPAGPPLPKSWSGTILALLADGRLMAVRMESGKEPATLLFGQPRSEVGFKFAGHYMALSGDDRTLYVIIPGAPGSPATFVVFEAETLSISALSEPDNHGGTFTSLAVGPESGSVYLVGRRPGALIISQIEPLSGKELAVWTAPELNDEVAQVYQAAFFPTEGRIYVSFIAGLNGIDWFDIDGASLRPCREWTQRQFRRCVEAQGGFALYGGRMLAATGDSRIVAWGPDGDLLSGLNSYLDNNVLLDFAVDSAATQLYAVGSCGYAGGYSNVEIDVEAFTEPREQDPTPTPVPPRVFVPPDPPGVVNKTAPCGQRLAPGPGSLLVAGRIARLLPEAGSMGALLLMDRNTGQVLRTIPTPSEPVDVVVMPDTD